MPVACYDRCLQHALHLEEDMPDRHEDAATAALQSLIAELETCIDLLRHAHERAEHLLQERRHGRPWLDIVSAESRPLVVESISSVMASLASAGHVWRREQARALNAEDVSINRIAALFGVTRQRISALLRDTGSSDDDGSRA
jgi:hypothetical protein